MRGSIIGRVIDEILGQWIQKCDEIGNGKGEYSLSCMVAPEREKRSLKNGLLKLEIVDAIGEPSNTHIVRANVNVFKLCLG